MPHSLRTEFAHAVQQKCGTPGSKRACFASSHLSSKLMCVAAHPRLFRSNSSLSEQVGLEIHNECFRIGTAQLRSESASHPVSLSMWFTPLLSDLVVTGSLLDHYRKADRLASRLSRVLGRGPTLEHIGRPKSAARTNTSTKRESSMCVWLVPGLQIISRTNVFGTSIFLSLMPMLKTPASGTFLEDSSRSVRANHFPR
ncbi:uncharacterized protein MEPE_03435 [Melanopsichium pennsylvanicum]|uniref:Uncharacterized protein n=1 Tax=Melanopsichium pennsylvanicum TaxID=63383 RepID=A0AAJ4XMP8_9BASI|nr:uncharacterized protein MEPE_03435 [Melanopsichium pennsylvanicum]